MRKIINAIRKVSTLWIVFVLLLLTNGVPIFLISAWIVNSTIAQVEEEQKEQLSARVAAQANAIDAQLQEFETATSIVASYARPMLLRQIPLTLTEQNKRLEKYTRDGRGVLGLDQWYETYYYPEYGDNELSNLYLSREVELAGNLPYLVAVTEELDPLFRAVVERRINTQWIYLTTRQGLIRLYPWHPNNYANNNPAWQPQTESFYTVANKMNNPDRQAKWTLPYHDLAGAGLMVTNSIPIYDAEYRRVIAVLSHDYLIEALQTEILNFAVGQTGFAFLLDGDGHVIVHRKYNNSTEGHELGEPLTISLAEKEPEMQEAVQAILENHTGVLNVITPDGTGWLVSYHTIPTTDWHLAMVISMEEVLEPANAVVRQAIVGFFALVLISIPFSWFLAKAITRPTLQLASAAQDIETAVAKSREGLALQQVDLSHIAGPKEIAQLVQVFESMVNTLQNQMNELATTYAIGQTVIAQLDYEATLRGVLQAVGQTVEYSAAEVAILEETELIVSVWHGQTGYRNTTGVRYKFGQGLTGRVASTQQVVFMPTLSEADTQHRLLASAGNQNNLNTPKEIHSFLGIPLIVDDRLIGVLTLVHHLPNHFTERDARQLSRLAGPASIAIDNALQVRQREGALKAQIRELQIKISDAQRTRGNSAVNTQYFRSLRDQARELRLKRR